MSFSLMPFKIFLESQPSLHYESCALNRDFSLLRISILLVLSYSQRHVWILALDLHYSWSHCSLLGYVHSESYFRLSHTFVKMNS